MRRALPFAELLDELRVRGFPITVEHYQRVARVVEGLDGESPGRVPGLICPVVATTEDEQRRFHEEFARWYPRWLEQDTPAATKEVERQVARRRRWSRAYVAATLLLLVALAVGVWWWTRTGKVVGPGAGAGTVTVPPPPPTPPQVERFTPRMAHTVTAVEALGPTDAIRVLLILPAVLLALYLLYERYRKMTAVVERRKPGSPTITGERRVLRMPDKSRFAGTLARLRRREETGAVAVDADATVRATIDKLGFPELRYRPLTRRPEYLLLLDRRSRRDHQATLLEDIPRALEDAGIIAHAHFYNGDPRVCTSRKTGRTEFLLDLRHKHADARLVVLTDGGGLVDRVKGDWTPGARLLIESWRRRAILTPKRAAEWRAAELWMAREFALLPATSDGVDTLSNYFDGARRGEAGQGRAPEAPRVERTWSRAEAVAYAGELRAYLSEPAFLVLSGLAWYPQLLWDLTLRVVDAIAPDLMRDEVELARLFRVQWFRMGSMPEEVAQVLAESMPTEKARVAREVIGNFLNEAQPAEGEADSNERDARQFEIVVQKWGILPKDRARMEDDVAVARLAAASPDSGVALRLPEPVRRVLFRRGLPLLGLRMGVVAVLALLAVGGLAWVAVPPLGRVEVARYGPWPPDWWAGMKPSGPVVGEARVNPADGLEYVWIPAGRFVMGCSPGDTECFDSEKPAHPVEITRGFWMGRTEVTQAAYQRVMGSNPSNFKGDDLPVEQVDWNAARNYCAKVGGRLPTEAEWEYAARGGTPGGRYGELNAIAWYSDNSGSKTHAVRTKQANAYGLHDMLGNVYEWTGDWLGAYQAGQTVDPKGSGNVTTKGIRGGGWYGFSRDARASYRYGVQPDSRVYYLGFRCGWE